MSKQAEFKVVPDVVGQPNRDYIVVYGPHGIGIKFTDDPASIGNMRQAGFVTDLLAAARDLTRFVTSSDLIDPQPTNALHGIEFLVGTATALDAWLIEHGQQLLRGPLQRTTEQPPA